VSLASASVAAAKLAAALYPREKWTPSQWAENCRVLGEDESSEPGRYTFERTPYWRFLADLLALPGIEELVLLKGAQIGWSEFCRNLIGYWIDLDPGPTLILAPDELSAENFKVERLEPLIKNTPAVARHITARARDQIKTRLRFDTMSLFLAWAGSKSGTKSRPIRYLICEEPDEYPAFSSTGGDPLSKAYKRLTTYADKGRARALIGGTPTRKKGNVWKRWEACAIHYHPWLPCPHCNGYQRLEWKQVRWPKLEEPDRAKRAERIETENLAHYECEHCKQAIRDHHKPRMLLRLVWATEDQAVTRDGRVVGPQPRGKRVGVKISGLYSPWVKFATLAREWLEAQGDPDALADFINQRLAETFEEQRQKTEPDFIAAKAKSGPPPLLIPRWAVALIATADTQGTDEHDGYFYYVIRAWGYGYRSQLVDFGICHSKPELTDRCLGRRLPIEKPPPDPLAEIEPPQEFATPQMLLVDSGGPRFQEIYELAQSEPRIHPTKGESHNKIFLLDERMQRRHGVVLWLINTEQSKDLLHRLIHDPDRTRWLPHAGVNDDYCRQMTAESKVWDPALRRETWQEIVKNNNHFWDCEHQQVAAAWKLGCGAPPPAAPPAAAQTAGKAADRPGWLPERPQKWMER
jgi:phage terminase large subunit GpA-like protein